MHVLTSESKFEGSRTTDNGPMYSSQGIIHRTRALKASKTDCAEIACRVENNM